MSNFDSFLVKIIGFHSIIKIYETSLKTRNEEVSILCIYESNPKSLNSFVHQAVYWQNFVTKFPTRNGFFLFFESTPEKFSFPMMIINFKFSIYLLM